MSKERRDKLDEKKVRNADGEIIESHRREQRMNEEKIEQNPKVLNSKMHCFGGFYTTPNLMKIFISFLMWTHIEP